MEEKKETRGGARPGAGQPKKDPTEIVGIRVPIELAPEFKVKAKELLVKIKAAARRAKNK